MRLHQPGRQHPVVSDLEGLRTLDGLTDPPAVEAADLFSGRACPFDGTVMDIEHRDDSRRRWICPRCGTRYR